MEVTVPGEEVYRGSGVPDYSWETYQRGFLGILNNAYNQSCNAGSPKLGVMNEIEASFVTEYGSGTWQEFARFYVREHDGHWRVQRAVDAMTDNLHDRVRSIGGDLNRTEARYWSRKYIWSMVVNSYMGFCSERTAIEHVASSLDLPYTTIGKESDGIDGTIGNATVQVKPESYMGLDLNDHDADYTISYREEDDVFVFDVPEDLSPVS